MIPAEQVHPGAANVLLQYLVREVYQALSDRRPLETRWKRFEQAYRAQPEVEIKEFPFLGAANLVIPIVATDVDTIFARIMGILFAPENLWSFRPLRPDMVDYAPRIQEFMQWAQNNELNAYDAMADWILEICKYGTGILKQRYRRQSRWAYTFRETPQGNMEQVREVTVADSPRIEHVSLEDFLVPASALDIQSAPWVAERVKLSYDQYIERVKAGIYMYSERIHAAYAQVKGGQLQQEMMKLDAFQQGLGDKLQFWECWLDFDVSGRGNRMPILATIHLESMTLVRLDYNPFMNQERPYSAARFLRQPKRFYGIGLAEMLMPTQDEVTAMHNQRIDAGTVANAPMWKALRNAGISENEPTWPGRVILVDDMGHIEPMTYGRAYDQSVQYEGVTVDYARRRTGVNDYMVGAAGPATGYSTATTTISLLQEAARKIDQSLREIRNAVAESGIRCLELYQQFNQGGKIFAVLGEKDGAMMQQILGFPMEMLRYSIGVDTTATSAALNKEVEIRTNMLVMELVGNFYQQIFQGMMIVVNPQLPPELRMLAIQMVMGGSLLARRTLESYGIQDTDRLIPDMRSIIGAGQQQQPGLGQPVGGTPLLPGAPVQPSGMGGIPPGAAGPAPAGAFAVGNGRYPAGIGA